MGQEDALAEGTSGREGVWCFAGGGVCYSVGDVNKVVGLFQTVHSAHSFGVALWDWGPWVAAQVPYCEECGGGGL